MPSDSKQPATPPGSAQCSCSANFVAYAVMLTRKGNGEMFVAHGPEGTRAIYSSRFDAVAFKRVLAEHKIKTRVMKVRVELSSPNAEVSEPGGQKL